MSEMKTALDRMRERAEKAERERDEAHVEISKAYRLKEQAERALKRHDCGAGPAGCLRADRPCTHCSLEQAERERDEACAQLAKWLKWAEEIGRPALLAAIEQCERSADQ